MYSFKIDYKLYVLQNTLYFTSIVFLRSEQRGLWIDNVEPHARLSELLYTYLSPEGGGRGPDPLPEK